MAGAVSAAPGRSCSAADHLGRRPRLLAVEQLGRSPTEFRGYRFLAIVRRDALPVDVLAEGDLVKVESSCNVALRPTRRHDRQSQVGDDSRHVKILPEPVSTYQARCDLPAPRRRLLAVPTPDPAVIASRVRAAMALANLGRRDAAAAMHVGVGTLDRIVGTRSDSPRVPTWEELRLLADACGVPFSWFWADFDRLDEIAPDDRAPEVFLAGRAATPRPARRSILDARIPEIRRRAERAARAQRRRPA